MDDGYYDAILPMNIRDLEMHSDQLTSNRSEVLNNKIHSEGGVTKEVDKTETKKRKARNSTNTSLSGETREERLLRLQRMRDYLAKKKLEETAEERKMRLKKDREANAKRRSEETPEQRDERLRKDRERKKQRRSEIKRIVLRQPQETAKKIRIETAERTEERLQIESEIRVESDTPADTIKRIDNNGFSFRATGVSLSCDIDERGAFDFSCKRSKQTVPVNRQEQNMLLPESCYPDFLRKLLTGTDSKYKQLRDDIRRYYSSKRNVVKSRLVDSEETWEERMLQLQRMRKYMAKKKSDETTDQHDECLRRDRERQAKRRLDEMQEKRDERLKKDLERMERRRSAKKRSQETLEQMEANHPIDCTFLYLTLSVF